MISAQPSPHAADSAPSALPPLAPPPAYVRRNWCVWLSLGLILLGLVTNLAFLYWNCPVDLSEDESHYWEWSRHIDYGYYSKPPGIAWVIYAATWVGRTLGVPDTGAAMMPIVRTPAVLFGVLSGLLSWALARRMFRDDRAGLAVLLLSAAVPMFTVGSLLITIDAPMYLCWAATVYCLWRFVEPSGQWPVVSGQNAERGSPTPLTTDHRPLPPLVWLYLAALAGAAGMLFKPVLIAIPACVLVAMALDPLIRRRFKTMHSLAALAIMLLSLLPVVLWNYQHDWVTFRHIGTQGGFLGSDKVSHWYDPFARLGTYIGEQAGGLGGFMFVLLVLAVIHTWKHRKSLSQDSASCIPHSAFPFLLAFALPLWGFYLVMNLWANTEANWPAASYFAAMVLLASHVVSQWTMPGNAAGRRWIVFIILWGVLLGQIAQNTWRLYPLVAAKLAPLKGDDAYAKSPWHPKHWDLSARLQGWQDRAAVVQQLRTQMRAQTGRDPLLVTSRYDTSSSLAFYLPGQPFVYSIMSYTGSRQSQYDIWPGLDERRADGTPVHAGQDALIIGSYDKSIIESVLRPAFERLEKPQSIPVLHAGVVLRNVVYFRAYGFKGLPGRRGGPY